MSHWADPSSRGVYDHPHATPPLPHHPRANDLSTRLARVEEHVRYSAHDRRRIEDESRLRARDLGAGMHGLHQRVTVLEQDKHTRRVIGRLAWTLARSAGTLARWLLAGLLAVLYMTGTLTLDGLKALLAAFGLPGG